VACLRQDIKELQQEATKFQPLLRQVDVLRAERDEAVGLLAEVQWGVNGEDAHNCPACGSTEAEHRAGCRIDEFLSRTVLTIAAGSRCPACGRHGRHSEYCPTWLQGK
jgi:hypothetical protein